MKKKLSILAVCLLAGCVFYATAQMKYTTALRNLNTERDALATTADPSDLQAAYNDYMIAAERDNFPAAAIAKIEASIANKFGDDFVVALRGQYATGKPATKKKKAEEPVAEPLPAPEPADDADILASIDQLEKDIENYKNNTLTLELGDLEEALESAQGISDITDAARKAKLADSIAFLKAEIAKLKKEATKKPTEEPSDQVSADIKDSLNQAAAMDDKVAAQDALAVIADDLALAVEGTESEKKQAKIDAAALLVEYKKLPEDKQDANLVSSINDTINA